MSRAVVVGGGPVGALAATRLAKQGWEVHVSPPWHCMKFTLGQSA